jgi:hypothetical protein
MPGLTGVYPGLTGVYARGIARFCTPKPLNELAATISLVCAVAAERVLKSTCADRDGVVRPRDPENAGPGCRSRAACLRTLPRKAPASEETGASGPDVSGR